MSSNTKQHDAIVIGAGSAGETCAAELASGGMKVAIVEHELVAGECKYWACMPAKTLLRPGEVLAAALTTPGVQRATRPALDAKRILAWRDYMVSDYDDTAKARALEEQGVTVVRGSAHIAGRGVVAVGDERLESDRIVIATGSAPVIPPIDAPAELPGVWTNREAMGACELPDRLLILGGGPVGVEIGQAYSRMGVSVALVERSDRLLPNEIEAAGHALGRALSDEGIELHLGESAEHVAAHGDGYALTLGDGRKLVGDKLLVATGRKPRMDALGLDSVGIHPPDQGIHVDERMRAGDGIWAVGDVTGIMPFTHVGGYQARVAAADMLGQPARADYRAIPRVIFTDPQVAAVGSTDGEHDGTADLSGLARSATYTEDPSEWPGFLTLISDGRKLTGACAVGPEAGEWLGQATLAVRAEVPLDIMRDTIQPFPTFSEAYRKALASLYEKLSR